MYYFNSFILENRLGKSPSPGSEGAIEFFIENTEDSKLLLHHFLPNWERYLLMSIVPIYFMLISLTQQNPMSIFEGVREIIVQPDILITDYFVVGGVGAAFFQCGMPHHYFPGLTLYRQIQF